MDESARKLRSLARQSRALSLIVMDPQRAQALQALARIYDRQAAELDFPQNVVPLRAAYEFAGIARPQTHKPKLQL